VAHAPGVVEYLSTVLACSEPVLVDADNGTASRAPEMALLNQERLLVPKDVYAFLQHFTRLPGLTDTPLIRMC
jgi:hypothetical protein